MKGVEEIAESSVVRQLPGVDFLGLLCTRGPASAWWQAAGIMRLTESALSVVSPDRPAMLKPDINIRLDAAPCGTLHAVLGENGFANLHLC